MIIQSMPTGIAWISASKTSAYGLMLQDYLCVIVCLPCVILVRYQHPFEVWESSVYSSVESCSFWSHACWRREAAFMYPGGMLISSESRKVEALLSSSTLLSGGVISFTRDLILPNQMPFLGN